MKFGLDINGAQGTNPNDLDYPLTFHLAPPVSQSFHLSCEISEALLDHLTKYLKQTFTSQRQCNMKTLAIP